jgi:hypothetical protein
MIRDGYALSCSHCTRSRQGGCVDWDYAVLLLTATVVGFAWRRTRNQILYYAWLGIVQIEIFARKERDRKGGPKNL